MSAQTAETVFEIEGALKTTQAGKLVIHVIKHLSDQCESGEIFTLDGKRNFRMVGKGQPFPASESAVATYARETNNSKAQARRDCAGVYLYVEEITPAPVITAPATTETCTACGATDPRGMFCVMSDDGEGPHQLVSVQRISADDAAFLDRVAVHAEQGAAER